MKLTKKFIKENAEMTLKEAFPEVFETVLEVGKWYRSGRCLVCINKIIDKDTIYGYGFDGDKWYGTYDTSPWGIVENTIPATPQEIQDALEKEAVRRGYKEYVMFKSAVSNYEAICDGKFTYNQKLNELYTNYTCIFSNGKFSTIIQTITKQEAEERLGMKII